MPSPFLLVIPKVLKQDGRWPGQDDSISLTPEEPTGGGRCQSDDSDPGRLAPPWTAQTFPGSRTPFRLRTAQTDTQPSQALFGETTERRPGGACGMKSLPMSLTHYQLFPKPGSVELVPTDAVCVFIIICIIAANISCLLCAKNCAKCLIRNNDFNLPKNLMRRALLHFTDEELRHREVRQLAQEHTAGRRQNWDGSPSHLPPEHRLVKPNGRVSAEFLGLSCADRQCKFLRRGDMLSSTPNLFPVVI